MTIELPPPKSILSDNRKLAVVGCLFMAIIFMMVVGTAAVIGGVIYWQNNRTVDVTPVNPLSDLDSKVSQALGGDRDKAARYYGFYASFADRVESGRYKTNGDIARIVKAANTSLGSDGSMSGVIGPVLDPIMSKPSESPPPDAGVKIRAIAEACRKVAFS